MQFLKKIFLSIFLFTLISSALADELIIEPEAGRQPLLNAILHANHSIDLVIYGFTDETLRNALLNAEHENKNVRILIEPHPYKNDNENSMTINTIQPNNLHLANPAFALTHQKTLIIDQHTAYIMTFNFTHSTFKKQRNFALVITDPAMIQEIQQVFNADWQHQPVSVNQPNLIWSPNNSRARLMEFIHEAKSSIKIYSENLTDYQTIGELAKAARKGIHVQVISSILPREKALNYIKNAGIQISKSDNLEIHAKVIIRDHEKALLGSMNLTKHSIDKNRELSVITSDKTVIAQLEKTFDNDWQGKTLPTIDIKKLPYLIPAFLYSTHHHQHKYHHRHRKHF